MHTDCLQLDGHRLGGLLHGRLLAWVDLVPVSLPNLFFFDHLVLLVRCPCNHLPRRADRRAAPGTMKIAPGMGSMVTSASFCKILVLSASCCVSDVKTISDLHGVGRDKSLRELALECGLCFRPIDGVQILGRHAFARILVNYPDKLDIMQVLVGPFVIHNVLHDDLGPRLCDGNCRDVLVLSPKMFCRLVGGIYPRLLCQVLKEPFLHPRQPWRAASQRGTQGAPSAGRTPQHERHGQGAAWSHSIACDKGQYRCQHRGSHDLCCVWLESLAPNLTEKTKMAKMLVLLSAGACVEALMLSCRSPRMLIQCHTGRHGLVGCIRSPRSSKEGGGVVAGARRESPVTLRCAPDEATEVMTEASAPHNDPVSGHATGAPVASGVSFTSLPAVWKLLNEQYAGWLLLNLVTVLWGSQHAIIKLALDDTSAHTSPAELNLTRFVIAAAVFVMAAFVPSRDREDSPVQGDGASAEAQGSAPEDTHQRDIEDRRGVGVLKAGTELGMYTFAGYAMQSIGLQYTSASRSAFLLYLNVKLVPILGLLLYGRRIAGKTWLNVGVALAGTVLLGYDGSPPNTGDAWSVAAAAASALFILRLEGAAQQYDPAKLNAVSMTTVSALCALWLGESSERGACTQLPTPALHSIAFDSYLIFRTVFVDPPESWSIDSFIPQGVALPAALYLGLVTTALTSYLQSVGKPWGPGTRAGAFSSRRTFRYLIAFPFSVPYALRCSHTLYMYVQNAWHPTVGKLSINHTILGTRVC